MTRTAFNFLIDTLLLVLIVSLAATGLLLHYVLPPGSRGGSGLSLWGWTRHEWGDLHFWIALALVALLVLHVALHWSWVCATVEHWFRRKSLSGAVSVRRRYAIGVAFGLLVAATVGGFLSLAWAVREGEPGGRSGSGWQARHESDEKRGGHDFGTGQIRGSMTLADLERETGVSAEVIKRELGLPAATPSTERLGDLKRRYSFEMSTVRRIVNRHQSKRSPGSGE